MSVFSKRVMTKSFPEDSGSSVKLAHSSETLLQGAFKEDAANREDAAAKIARTEALMPTAEELRLSDQIIKGVSNRFAPQISETGLENNAVKAEIITAVTAEVEQLCAEYEARERLKKLVLSSIFGLGPIEAFMLPTSTVSDIVVQRYDSIYIEDENGLRKVDAQFNSEAHLRGIIERIIQRTGRQINIVTPAVDARLGDGTRIHATIPPITPDGATLTIRRFNNRPLSSDDYVRMGALNEEMLQFLAFAVSAAKLNILVSGGTSSGKTTLLNMLSSFIPENELIITIEDNCELQLKQKNVRRMEARFNSVLGENNAEITIQDLVRHSLRMRPDRIIVGESRDGSIVDMFAAMSTGHAGSMSTIHSDSPRALLDSRIPALFSQYNVNFTKETQTLMTAEAVQLIVQIARERDFSRKITSVSAIDGIDPTTGSIRLAELYRYDRTTNRHIRTEQTPEQLITLLKERGCEIPTYLYAEKCTAASARTKTAIEGGEISTWKT